MGAIVTGHRTPLTIAIADSATTMKMEVQNIKQCCERNEQKKFLFGPPIVTFYFLGTLVANEVKKIQMNLFGGNQTAVWGGVIAPVPLPGYITDNNAIIIRTQSA